MIAGQGTRPQPGAALTVPPGPGLPRGLVIDAGELVERFSRASGPGGQGVNTTDSRVELDFDPSTSRAVAALPEATRDRLLNRLAAQLVGGRLLVVASEHRSQRQNRVAARHRLTAILREAAAPDPPTRRPTRPTLGSQRRRVDSKKRRGQLKTSRRTVDDG
ncbi:ribosome-associated protein [Pedococcus dokdonensis]|uniref:Ribosome-associated protein n=1 Tax=Pedococcus dokdonensis TaxID=443156 RepID=A0A1H0QZZ9_9MICO|nr:alternative ribosome rescue aminoacyl-tRNA hydrolase ArfB [Pedococcus dokdonensis]SDP22366.1 ribosome-associated protein [Pedococcus dokdonensis]